MAIELHYCAAEPCLMPDPDVVVVGAGPGGTVAAATLARAGLRVTLVEKSIFPRDKICGDFIGPHGLRTLEELGVTGVATSPDACLVRDGAVFVSGRRALLNPMPAVAALPPYGCVIRRVVLDERLFRMACDAGVERLEGCTFVDYALEQDSVNVKLRVNGAERSIRTRVLVGADGSASLVARRLHHRAQPAADRIIAVRAYFDEVAAPFDCCELYFHPETFPGYLWIFPVSGRAANVGVGMVHQTTPPTREQLRDLLLRHVATDPAVRQRLQGAKPATKIAAWPLSTYAGRLPLVGPRVLLVGDAAGLINPLNGEGIQYAIASGRLAGETIAGSLARGDVSRESLGEYARRVEFEFGLDLALNRYIVRWLSNRALNPVWLGLVRSCSERADRDRAYSDVVGAIVAGLIPTREALRWPTLRRTLEAAQELLARTPPGEFALQTLAASVAMLGHPRATLRWAADTTAAGFDLLFMLCERVLAERTAGFSRLQARKLKI